MQCTVIGWEIGEDRLRTPGHYCLLLPRGAGDGWPPLQSNGSMIDGLLSRRASQKCWHWRWFVTYELLMLRSLGTLLHQELVKELVKFDRTAHMPVAVYVTS